jgi:hypothetical protein
MASLRNLAIGILKLTGTGNIAAACRYHCRDATRTLATLGLTPAIARCERGTSLLMNIDE